MKEIKTVDPMSLAKISLVMGVFIGVVVAIFFIIIGSSTYDLEELGSTYLYLVGGAYLILYPIIGFISGLITGWLYNLAVKWVGGIKISFKE